ncbi:NfeD family protein [Neoroseomonas oryzicola]|uniref:NfeD family protein n=1 Tax=Neoroseomonas oryzicola TaxID=535904 RepID=A0A9X9WK60_9PROT|nr:NfeD family protein [Neoroseomonas oryzicola]NKE15328.1 NfeD family protein [Neoroseomonas oryzicola]
MDPALIWILVGLVLLGAETLLPGVFLLWIGLASVGTGIMLLLVTPPFWVTVTVFIVLLAAGIAVALRLRRSDHPRPRVNTPDAGLVGRFGVLVEPGMSGPRVRVGDSDWAARLPRDVSDSPAGTRVRVEGVDGTTLIVRPD